MPAQTLSHSFRRPRLRHFLRTLDQVCIFFLIAGTYTPWGLTFYGDGWGTMLLGTMWALALAGAGFKLFVTGHENVAVVFYVLLGWLPALGVFEIVPRIPGAALLWMLAGGLCYTLGAYVFFAHRRTPPLFPRHLAPDGHRRQHLPLLCHHAVRSSLYCSIIERRAALVLPTRPAEQIMVRGTRSIPPPPSE